jgi:hypothetical protein
MYQRRLLAEAGDAKSIKPRVKPTAARNRVVLMIAFPPR